MAKIIPIFALIIFVVPIPILLLLSISVGIVGQQREHASEVRAVKGQLFVHMLHSAYFFPQTVEVKWSASVSGRPGLPHWLHMFPSQHRSIAFLIGTPVSPHSQFPIHVIAHRLDTFESAERSFSIVTNDDIRFNGAAQQIAEIRLTNVDAEELIWKVIRGDQMAKGLERAIQSIFRGRGVNPFIFNILSSVPNPPPDDDVFHHFRHKLKLGSIVEVGTQTHFHPNVLQLARGIQMNPEFCIQNKLIPMDRHFRSQQLTVDWCKFDLRNMTLLKELEESNAVPTNNKMMPKLSEQAEQQSAIVGTTTERDGMLSSRGDDVQFSQQQRPVVPVYYIWESVLVFPLLAVFCLLFILCLSLIFFGRREGQHWRDYKTPKDQLDEYLNLRESQRQLRDLSVQRQIMLINQSGRAQSEALSIGTFLRPREEDSSPPMGDHQTLIGTPKPEFTSKATIGTVSRSSIGKQTVAEAARATGGSVHPYRHPPPPLDSDTEVPYAEFRG